MVVKKALASSKPKNIPTIILGVDSSSTGIAWTVLEDGYLKSQGKIRLEKVKGLEHKLAVVYEEWQEILAQYKPDVVYIEQSIYVKSPGTFRTLSCVVGSLICIAAGEGYRTQVVEPSTWKAYFKYKNLSRVFVDTAKKKLGIAEANKLCERLRKSQTWRVIAHNYPNEAEGSLAASDHDLADSWGIALYAYVQETGPIQLEITDSIRLDLEELDKLGLKL
jgi:hypothetical protein